MGEWLFGVAGVEGWVPGVESEEVEPFDGKWLDECVDSRFITLPMPRAFKPL